MNEIWKFQKKSYNNELNFTCGKGKGVAERITGMRKRINIEDICTSVRSEKRTILAPCLRTSQKCLGSDWGRSFLSTCVSKLKKSLTYTKNVKLTQRHIRSIVHAKSIWSNAVPCQCTKHAYLKHWIYHGAYCCPMLCRFSCVKTRMFLCVVFSWIYRTYYFCPNPENKKKLSKRKPR